MNDREFKELLNLYLDHEISGDDARRLELEVQKIPARRQRYLQYCRMQKACSLLSDELVEQAASGDTRNISGFVPAEARWWTSSYAAASLVTLAACVAFILVMRPPARVPVNARSVAAAPVPTGPQPVATALMERMADSATASLRTVSGPVHRGEFQSVIAPYSFRSPRAADAPVDSRLNWLQNVQLVSLPATTPAKLQFQTKAAPATVPPSFGPLPAPTESNALQFQR